MLSSNIITKRLIFKIMLMNSVFTILNIFLCFRNKVPPRPAGQRTEPEPSTVRYQLLFQIFFQALTGLYLASSSPFFVLSFFKSLTTLTFHLYLESRTSSRPFCAWLPFCNLTSRYQLILF